MYTALKHIALRIIPRSTLQRLNPLIRPFLRWWYRGDAVHCPVCGHSFKQFIRLGDHEGADLLCPNCSSIPRKRLLWLYLESHFDKEKESIRVLDFSPHPEMAKRLRAMPNLEYITSDFETTAWDEQYDITNIPQESDSFDLILCYHVLEHVPDDQKAMQELFRILKQKGLLLTQVPHREEPTDEDPTVTDPEERLRRFGQDDHVRYYNRQDFKDRLAKAGFSPMEVPFAQKFSAEDQARFGLNKQEIMFFCTIDWYAQDFLDHYDLMVE